MQVTMFQHKCCVSITATPGPALLNIGDCANDLKGLSRHSLGAEGELFGVFYSPFILTKPDKSSEPVDLCAIKASKEI